MDGFEPCSGPFLAIDVGGTATRAVVVAADGACLGYGVAGSGNPVSSGPEHATTAIMAAAGDAAAQAGVDLADVAGAVAAIAGGSGPAGAVLHAELVRAGLPAGLSFQADLLATYLSGTRRDEGYAMVAGTGTVAARVRGGQLDRICDGLGWLLGDGGSGFWVGQQVARAVTGTLDGREPPTALVDRLAAELGVPASLRPIVDALYRLRPVELARFARLAFDGAGEGDAVAAAIVAAAGDALALAARVIVANDVDGPIVLGGSVLGHQPAVAARVVDEFRACGVTGDVVAVENGVIGAAVLAMRHGGLAVDDESYARIGTTLARR